MLADYNLNKKIVVITGSSRGIGSSIAKQFALHGSRIVITYLNSKAEALKTEKSLNIGSTESLVVQCDITDPISVDNLVKQVKAKFKRIDILINNAGAVFEPANWSEISNSNWNKTISANLTGTFNCIQKIAPGMIKQKFGKIINISSTASFCPSAHAIAYSAAKAGVISLTQAFAKEFAPYINVNSVAPGWTDTDWHHDKNKDFFDKVKSIVPFGRLAKTDEIASAVVFLSSNQANFITGQTIMVDGGASLKK